MNDEQMETINKEWDGKNLGVILEPLAPTDLVFGANDRVVHNITIESRNWLDYYSRGELQIGTYYDTMGCVSFSANKVIEAILNYLLRNNMISQENVDWLNEKGYVGEDGNVNLSDRFLTAMSDTGPNGNTGGKVWWTARNMGVVPESYAPWDKSREAVYAERFGSWFRDPANINEKAKRIGKEFVERFDLFYESIIIAQGVSSGLEHSPLQVFIPTACPYDQNRVQQYCGAGITHAVSMCDDLEPRGYYPLFDHYINQPKEQGQEQFIRRVVANYPFYPSGYVCTIIEKNVIHNDEDMPNDILKGDEKPEVYEVGKDKKLRHIYNPEVFNEGVKAGNWKDWPELQEKPQAEVDAMEKGKAHAFII